MVQATGPEATPKNPCNPNWMNGTVLIPSQIVLAAITLAVVLQLLSSLGDEYVNPRMLRAEGQTTSRNDSKGPLNLALINVGSAA